MKNPCILICLLLHAQGCTHVAPLPPSAHHLASTAEETVQIEREIAKPAPRPDPVPVPRANPPEQVYSVVVSDVPVREILFALARESKFNVDIHPAIQGNVTLNAVDQTLTAILARLSRQVDLHYQIDGNTLSIAPDLPVLRSYKVNYVNIDRETAATLGVGSEITSGTADAAASRAAKDSSRSTTTIQSKSRINFWELAEQNIRNILKSTRSQAATNEERSARAEAARTAQEARIRQVEAVSRAGAGAEKLYQEAFRSGNPVQPDSRDDVIVNPMAGTITVMATVRQHGYIRQYLDAVMDSVQRQVLIEATIVEVALSDNFKSGVDWSRLGSNGALKGFTWRQNLTGAANLLLPTNVVGAGATLLSTPGFILGYNNTSSPLGDLAASITWLQTFGDTRVLSSPKIMAINNQSALLKVVDNVVYFKVEVTPATVSSSGAVISPATYTTTPQNVSVGVVMSVTPQINENGNVALNVRPTISRIIDFVNDPNPQLAIAGVTNLVPQIQVREMESVLQVDSGQTIVLGGLMQDEANNQDKNLPGISRLPLIGKLFQAKNDTRKKTELVIFLRPTVIRNASLDAAGLQSFRSFLPEQLTSAHESAD